MPVMPRPSSSAARNAPILAAPSTRVPVAASSSNSLCQTEAQLSKRPSISATVRGGSRRRPRISPAAAGGAKTISGHRNRASGGSEGPPNTTTSDLAIVGYHPPPGQRTKSRYDRANGRQAGRVAELHQPDLANARVGQSADESVEAGIHARVLPRLPTVRRRQGKRDDGFSGSGRGEIVLAQIVT